MERNKLLQHPAPEYQSFVDNQVLTDDQLNNMLGHLNYQDQLSRVLLSGVGIVCGLDISYDGDDHTITLTKGAAVTTDGNLMKFEGNTFTAYKKFEDPYAKYAPFTNEDDSTIPLWELETDDSPSDVKLLENFSAFDLEEAIGVLYFEDYLEEDEDCSPVDCNTQGRQVIQNIRVLLVQKSDMDRVLRDDSIITAFGEEPRSLAEHLPTQYVERVILSRSNTATYGEFLKAYDISLSKIAKRLKRVASLTLFKEIAEESGVNVERDLEQAKKDIFHSQYVYDFYKDLADGYNDLRTMLLEAYAICCPNPNAFPKHVLLGQLADENTSWRHSFYPSSTHSQTSNLAAMKRAFKRLLLLIKNFDVPPKGEIIITPSRGDDAVLGKRAVPYYYNLAKNEQAAAFINHWKQNGAEWVPNYYGAGYPKIDNFDPLDICLSGHDFYRVEGHVGQHVSDAHDEIQEIQKEKGLAFDIKQIAVGRYPDEATIDYDKYRVYFEDLQVVLQAWNEEQQCLMQTASKFFSGFSLNNPGAHADYMVLNADNENESNSDNNANRLVMTYAQPVYDTTRCYIEPQKTKKAKENYVIKGISEQQGTLGWVMQENNTISANADKSAIIYNTGKVLEHMVQDWQEDIKVATADIPVEMLGHLKETEDHKLTDIEDFTAQNLEKYIKALKAQCRQTQVSKKRFRRLTSLKDNAQAQPWMEQYQFMLNRIQSSCCLIEKVKVLYEKILERKQEVLEQLVLKNFIDQHPGAEHKAGVPRGGTLILLYYSEARKESPTVDRIRGERSIMAISRGSTQPVADWSVFEEPDHIEEISGDIITRDVSSRRRELFERNIPAPFWSRRSITDRLNIPHGTVVGDLCLPYVCCSGTPSTTFVFPEQLATLRMPVDHVCIGEEDADAVPLTVTPADGEVKAFIQKRELTNVIAGNQTGTYFNPNGVSPDDYGKAIRFEVNGQPVEPLLRVFEKPNANFSYSFNPETDLNQDNTVAVVTFTNESTPFNELVFEWDFDGEIVTNSNVKEFTHDFDVAPGENFDIPVALIASNGSCEDDFSDSVNIDVPPLEDEPPVEDPDEPSADNCEQVMAGALRKAAQLMDQEFAENQDLLSQFVPSYQDEVKPVYENILNNAEQAFSGDMDNELFKFIQDTQLAIQGRIGTVNTDIEREFALKIYYELILLYFYLQACRDDAIVVDDGIADVAGNWPKFTNQAARGFAEALKALLEDDAIHQKLTALRDQMQEQGRLGEQMAQIVDTIIEILTKFHGG